MRIISSDNVRALCIRHDFYTYGDCDDYRHLLNDLCGGYDRQEVSDADIEGIALDIVSHSDREVFKHFDLDEISSTTCLYVVAGLIANDCCVTTVVL